MKKIFKSFITLLCCGAIFASCEQEVPDTKMSVDLSSIEAEAQNPEEVAVTLTTNASWILTCPEWVTPSATYGSGDAILTFVIATNYKDETTNTKARSGEIKISGGGTLTGKGAVVTIPVTQAGHTYVDPNPSIGGIDSAAELMAFAKAVSTGGSIKRWQNDAGNVVLLADIDLSGVTEWTPIGSLKATGSPAYEGNMFTGVFDGQGHKITGINWAYDITEADTEAYGLFAGMEDATVKNLILGAEGDKITVIGSSEKVIAVGALTGHAVKSTITGITNNVSVLLASNDAAIPGDNLSGKLMMLGGIAGTVKAPMVVGTKDSPVKSYGEVATGKISNEGNGGTGMQVAGIVAFTVAVDGAELKMEYCYNYGGVSAPTGRGGGLVGSIGGATAETAKTTIAFCENHGFVQDDVVGMYGGETGKHNNKRMGGLVGGTADNKKGIVIDGCTNYGNVFSQVGCRTGGFVGHLNGVVQNCVNKGVILAKNSNADHGAGWACGFNGNNTLIVNCVKGGRVGDYDLYKDKPNEAPEASNDNACGYKNADRFNPAINQ